jgi:hypothetical protein
MPTLKPCLKSLNNPRKRFGCSSFLIAVLRTGNLSRAIICLCLRQLNVLFQQHLGRSSDDREAATVEQDVQGMEHFGGPSGVVDRRFVGGNQ